jgi:flagellin-like hook-associated protein FlgL
MSTTNVPSERPQEEIANVSRDNNLTLSARAVDSVAQLFATALGARNSLGQVGETPNDEIRTSIRHVTQVLSSLGGFLNAIAAAPALAVRNDDLEMQEGLLDTNYAEEISSAPPRPGI